MKVACDRAAVLAAVNLVAAVVPARTTIVAMSGLRLAATKTGGVGELTISGTDAETSVVLSMGQVDVAQPGTAVVPAEKLRAILQSADESDKTLSFELDGDSFHIKASHGKFKIVTFKEGEFPQIPDFAKAAAGARSVFNVPAGALRRLIDRTIFAIANETSRYAINGLLLKRDGKKLEMVATDGRRLALCRTTLKGAAGGEGTAFSCIVPRKALGLFQRLSADPEANVRVAITDNRIFFALDDGPEGAKDAGKKAPIATLSSALVEGAFPPYEDVIPKDQDRKITAAREEMVRAVRQAAVLTNEESRGVKMAFSNKKKTARITSRAPEMGESEIDLDLTAFEGEDLEISFNPNYLADALKTMDEPEVIIELKAANKPGVLRGGADFLYVVMPVNLTT